MLIACPDRDSAFLLRLSPDSVDRTVCQVAHQFSFPASNGVAVHTGDVPENGLTAIALTKRLERHQPAPLPFIEARKQQVQPMMVSALRMVDARFTQFALADWDDLRHRRTSASLRSSSTLPPGSLARSYLARTTTSASLQSQALPVAAGVGSPPTPSNVLHRSPRTRSIESVHPTRRIPSTTPPAARCPCRPVDSLS